MWLYDLPMAVGLPMFILLVVGGSCGILLVLRKWVFRVAPQGDEWDRVLSYAVGAYGVFYGVTLALIAAAAYGNFTEVDGVVLDESSSLATLYRSATLLPEPQADELQEQIVQYTRNVIDEDWPMQRHLEIPMETDANITAMQSAIEAVEPTSAVEVVYVQEALEQFQQLVHDRRDRIALTHLALPSVLWIVLGVGAVLNAILIGLIEVRNLRVHLLMSGMLALFVALLLYAIAGFDHAYAGPIAVTPEYFQDLLDGLFANEP
ncbi:MULTISPECIES: bestrophin-like domain [unclassified Microbacterium]|jgi:hypothetical protein|uniref:bestrophin-like domain n=1 Tax=unclassified Microbacterium TaxID=2609290 RepID=UPI0006FF8E19|nr:MULTISPECIES: DUF4239 domain-containing protein [unclassified Microbacterium]AOX46152.1 hypothetical protein BJP65_10295 [Microbacterium sp. BH-3-3-3]KQR84398.1 hypothetical protein ASF96_15940 [Microbacterium sp. Leaf179]KQT75485.1 hypothetical protein ASG45_03020 [Microbacterium sp. Leaf436]MBD8205734.1 DUF4239 domain-containing protein [Microbacterium sp. CFBP 8801]MBD8217651.1 DUF4239 domain-containing protein [Microbacterium sp. CFBP 13617]